MIRNYYFTNEEVEKFKEIFPEHKFQDGSITRPDGTKILDKAITFIDSKDCYDEPCRTYLLRDEGNGWFVFSATVNAILRMILKLASEVTPND